MTDQTTCCGRHIGRLRTALADQRRAASTIARAQGSGRKITDSMVNHLETAKRSVQLARENIENHEAELASEAA